MSQCSSDEKEGNARSRASAETKTLRWSLGSVGKLRPQEVFDEISQIRPFTKVVANPKRPSPKSLLKRFQDVKDKLEPEETLSLGYGLKDQHDLNWSRQRSEDGEDTEKQSIVLVAFDSDVPVGFASLSIALNHGPEDNEIALGLNILLVYVRPDYRGKGLGLDLSIASGLLCQDLLEATYRAAPARTTITPFIWADFMSEGGNRFTMQVAYMLTCHVDLLSESGRRKSIKVNYPEIDAGY
jgi:GNAT superfamily N-acetyltransferase